MRILILSQYYPPEPAIRLKDLTEYLKNQGHEVRVLTTFPSYPQGVVYDGYKMRLRKKSHEYGVDVTRVYSFPYRGMSKLKRLWMYFSFGLSALFLGLLPGKKPQVLYVYHPPLLSGWAAAIYSKLTGTKFVYDVQDVWPDAIVATGMMAVGSRPWRMLSKMEKFVYRRASQITVISEGMQRNLLRKGVPPEKLTIIPNWGNAEVYRPLPADEVRAEKGWTDKFVVMIAGNLSMTHDLESVIEAAALIDDSRVRIVFLGSGPVREKLMEMTKSKGLSNVEFLDRVKEESEAARIINAANVMLIHLKDAAEGDFSVPHRVFSYMLCGRPIIVASRGAAAEVVESQGCGWTCASSDPLALSKLITEVAADPSRCDEVGRRGLDVAKGELSREHLLRQIESVMERAVR